MKIPTNKLLLSTAALFFLVFASTTMAFQSGDRVQCTGTNVYVRDAPSTSGNILGMVSFPDEGTVLDGPYFADNYTWYHISWDTGLTGYTVDLYLQLVPGSPPTLTTDPAYNITSTSALINGTLNPNGLDTYAYFDWGTTTSYGNSTLHNYYGNGTSSFQIQSILTNLSPNTTYHFRAVAYNSAGTTYGSDLSFTTSSAGSPPTLTTDPAYNITSTSALVNGTLNPNGLDTYAYFDWGTTTSYGNSTLHNYYGNGTYSFQIQSILTNLSPNTTYHFRAVAYNDAGTTYGSDLSFTTSSAGSPPTLTTDPAYNITSTSALVNGTLNPNGLDTYAYFDWGLTSSYGSSTLHNYYGNGTSSFQIQSILTNLSPNTTYHFRAVAYNDAGTTYGDDVSFTTANGATPTPTIDPTPTVSPTPSTSPTATPTPTPRPTSTPTPTPTPVGSPVAVTVSLHSLRPDSITNLNGAAIDDPLIPTTDETILGASQPTVTQGLVADGVTPLLIQINSLLGPSQPTTFTISSVTVTGGSLSGSTIEQHLFTLHHPPTGPANYSSELSVVVSQAHPNGFAYISAIKCEEVQIPIINVQKELTVILTVQQADDASNVKQFSFKIRKPPVVLVHGFNSDSSTWSSGFLSEIATSRHMRSSPTDLSGNFVVPINYGVDPTSLKDPDFQNRTGSLVSLAQLLDAVLSSEIDSKQVPGIGVVGTYKDWALTRYDLVCHSQGGVLARMLCAQNPQEFGVSTNFQNSNNANRGRFRRIVTIGSPQNGSTLDYYANEVLDNVQLDLDGYRALLRGGVAWKDILVPKFDPFGTEIKFINSSSNSINQNAKFHAIRGSIVGFAPILYAFYLDESQISSVVIPRGSDGVVDFDSSSAAFSGSAVDTVPGYVCHSPPEKYFGVPDGSTETKLASVANEAIQFLDGPANGIFAPFVLPRLLDDNQRAAIDAVVPGVGFSDIFSSSSARSRRAAGSMSVSSTVEIPVSVTPALGEPLSGVPTWLVQNYGPDGISTDGITVVPTDGDPARATVTIPEELQGDLVLAGSYTSTNGKLIFGWPTVVFSQPVGATLVGISIEPPLATTSVGGNFSYEIWGNYDNGQEARLFEPVDSPAKYTSSAPSVASVNSDNTVTGKTVGSAIVTADFRGFSASSTVVVRDALASQMANISTRLNVGTSDNVLIGGFIISGTAAKTVLIRGIGPSLTSAGVMGALGDPILELHNPAGETIATNDDWSTSADKEAIIQTGIPPTNAKESAILMTLDPGPYTAILRGVNNTTGVGLIEVFDINPLTNSKLANISTRGVVQTGDNVLIGGLIITGANPTNTIVRAIGPSLPLSGTLTDPTLELYDSTGTLLASNDNWKDTQEAAIEATKIPPTSNAEAAIVVTLSPGAYTAIVRGKNDTTGVALVEAYQLDN